MFLCKALSNNLFYLLPFIVVCRKSTALLLRPRSSALLSYYAQYGGYTLMMFLHKPSVQQSGHLTLEDWNDMLSRNVNMELILTATKYR